MDDNIKIESCRDALKLNITDKSEVGEWKESLLEDFLLILQSYEHVHGKIIKSEKLTELWMFYTEGIYTRNIFSLFKGEELVEELNDIKWPFHKFIDTPVSLQKLVGPVFIQNILMFENAKRSLKMAKHAYDRIFSRTDDPVKWLEIIDKDVSNYYKIKNECVTQDEKNLQQKLNLICNILMDENNDPIFQK